VPAGFGRGDGGWGVMRARREDHDGVEVFGHQVLPAGMAPGDTEKAAHRLQGAGRQVTDGHHLVAVV
jgi:hypothetical protein